MFENVRELSGNISGEVKELEFEITDIMIPRNYHIEMRNRAISIYPEKRKDLKINKQYGIRRKRLKKERALRFIEG